MHTDEATAEVQYDQRKARQSLRRLFRIQLAQSPKRRRRAEWNIDIFGKYGKLGKALPILASKQGQALFYDCADRLVARLCSALFQCADALVQQDFKHTVCGMQH